MAFVPAFWAKAILSNLHKISVAEHFINRNYEGVIKNAGDKVHILQPTSIEVRSYDGSDITVDTDPEGTNHTLTIDQADYFNFVVKDITKAQNAHDFVNVYMGEAQYALRDVADKFRFKLIADGVHADHNITPELLTSANIYSKLTEAKRLLSLASVPLEGRKVALSPNEIALLENSSEFTPATQLGDQIKANGFMGRIAGFDVFETNNLHEELEGDVASGQPYSRKIICSTSMATTYADQVAAIERYRVEKNFGDGVKGLHIYGGKVLRSKSVVVINNRLGVAP